MFVVLPSETHSGNRPNLNKIKDWTNRNISQTETDLLFPMASFPVCKLYSGTLLCAAATSTSLIG